MTPCKAAEGDSVELLVERFAYLSEEGAVDLGAFCLEAPPELREALRRRCEEALRVQSALRVHAEAGRPPMLMGRRVVGAPLGVLPASMTLGFSLTGAEALREWTIADRAALRAAIVKELDRVDRELRDTWRFVTVGFDEELGFVTDRDVQRVLARELATHNATGPFQLRLTPRARVRHRIGVLGQAVLYAHECRLECRVGREPYRAWNAAISWVRARFVARISYELRLG